jgi:hypothetical protein
VSSNPSAAFVPVSAVPGGVPPGTPLYGAYGQPLPPSCPSSEVTPRMQSPTGEDALCVDEEPGRGRTRSIEKKHSSWPSPPNHPLDDDPRGRSPVSVDSSETPPAAGYAGYRQSPYNQDRPPSPISNSTPRPMAQQLQLRASQVALGQGPPQPPPPSSHATNCYSQSPAANYSQPPLTGYPPAPLTGYSNPMSLDNLTGPDPQSVIDIDRSMLSKLDGRNWISCGGLTGLDGAAGPA